MKGCILFLFLMTLGMVGCSTDKSHTNPTPAYATYYFPVFYPSYSYAPFYDQYYKPGPHDDNFNYYGYYDYWGDKKNYREN